MRILWIHQNLVTGAQAGNSRAVRTAAALLEAGAELDIIAGDRSYFGDVTTAGIAEEGKLRIHRLSLDPSAERAGSYLEFNRKAQKYARILGKPDLIFCSSPPLPQVATAAWLAKQWDIPWCLEVRDLWPAFVLEGGLLKDGAVATAMRALEAFAYRSAGAIISVSPGFVPYLRRMGCEEIVIAPSGGDPMLFDADPSLGEAWRERHGITGPLVVYAGSFNSAYGIPKILEAAAQSDATWVFAGNGSDRHLVEAADVIYLGSLPRDKLMPALLAADVGINSHAPWPLLDTTITGKLFDYMAAGLPVVSLRDGQMGAIIRAAGCGTVTSNLNAGIATVTKMPGAGAAGRKWLAKNMHADAMARRVAHTAINVQPTGFLRHVPGVLVDTVTRRSQHALDEVYGGRRQATIEKAFGEFVGGTASRPLQVPGILR